MPFTFGGIAAYITGMRDASEERAAFQRVLGARLRKARLARGLTATDLSAVLCCARRALVYYENGEQLPALDTLARIARAVDVPLSALVSPLDDLRPPEPHKRITQGEQRARRAAQA